MGFIRPATPGFLVTLVATILLAVVSFCVPYFKSIYFLKANISVSGINGSITFGTLGYCLELSNGTTCSKPSIGYQLDINGLVGNKLPIEIPQVAVKWITYALFLHVVALALSAGSAVFGLLAHVREMSMACCSTLISGLAAAVALIAFIFDIALFFVAKARINAIGSAQVGNAVWLTLAAWILLFFSGCFYTLGRCCISKRGPRSGGDGNDWKSRIGGGESNPTNNGGYAEQMRLDAVKAEADRKARQKATEGGLPAFFETQPLTARVDGDHVYTDDQYKDAPPTPTHTAGGYVPAPKGTRAVDEYYSPSRPNDAANTYPPQPQRQGSAHTYAPSTYTQNSPSSPTQQHAQPTNYAPAAGYAAAAAGGYAAYNAATTASPSPSNQHLSPHQQYATGQGYGHSAGGSSYHTAASHDQQPSYTPYDPYNSQPQQYNEPGFNAETYNNTAALAPAMPLPTVAGAGYSQRSNANPYYTSPSPPQQYAQQHQQYSQPSQYTQPERSYTLGGDGYGAQPNEHTSSYFPYGTDTHNTPPAPIDTNTGYIVPAQRSPVKGPRTQPVVLSASPPRDSPPGYDPGHSNITGAWGKQ
ncbi:SUR7/PalI family-domain-containing protein [Crucibulum laeve]|uniref:SUR7/PalI family-domain-containing protein n=1 Tax=Crucibulum laeve TaxID=68775 RepID=A0A5C3MAG8_9AGAR|nr:SUR7/PalI family-domain-containing protein [Crucibulum laeve]